MDKSEEATLQLHDAIIDLYLNVKIRHTEEIRQMNEDVLEDERNRLREVDSFTILEYIKTSVEILMNLKFQEQEQQQILLAKSPTPKKKKSCEDFLIPESDVNLTEINQTISSTHEEPPKDYEAMLQKLESEVRNHIRIEQQLKLHIESVQYKLEETEKHRDILQLENNELIETLKNANKHSSDLLGAKQGEIDRLRDELMARTESIAHLEEKARDTLEFEKRIALLQSQLQGEMGRSQDSKKTLINESQKSSSRSPLIEQQRGVPQKKINQFCIPAQYLHCSGSGGSETMKGGTITNPYLKEVYRKHLEEKQGELGKLKTKLSKIQRELSMKNSYSKEKLMYEAERIKEQRNKDHKRSSSHKASARNDDNEFVMLNEGKKLDKQTEGLRASQQKIPITSLIKGFYHQHNYSTSGTLQTRTGSVQPYRGPGASSRDLSSSKKKRINTPNRINPAGQSAANMSMSTKKYLKKFQMSQGMVPSLTDDKSRFKGSMHNL